MKNALIDEGLALGETVSDFLNSLAGAKKKRTIDWYRWKLDGLVTFLGDVPLESVSLRHLERFRASLVGECSPFTLSGSVRALKRFFSWCVREELLSSSPAESLELPQLGKRPRAGVRDETQTAIIAVVDDPRDRILFALLQESWGRAGEIVGLNVDDLDLDECSAVVTGKFEKSRTVHFAPETAELLREYLGGRRFGPVFLGRKKKRLTTSGLYQMVRRYVKKAGLPEIWLENDEKKPRWSPHQWRHAGIRSFLQSGSGSLGEASQLAGHANIKVTHDFYGTFEQNELKKVHLRWLQRGKKGLTHAD